ncbi:E2 protein [Bos taurus papillomavirus 19]|uniref:Regulatory protein E2 n=1 Tax=Bos taurus papillomavirus 19 TaxID=1887217 RepID=A0A1B2K234_9PAPI|nr:E2 protein [Bos taurus papillomavirus 19]ANZ90253.1 E2 protein [Bos taurus papillomavirus 19]
MENLAERFDRVQERLLELYEAGHTDIKSQIEHWDLVRKESLYLYVARQNGLRSLGFHPVPNLQVAEIRAKHAIEMKLLLTSLAESAFGRESWSLQDTSLEGYKAPPSSTFKKGATLVEVWFDGDPENSNAYTKWSSIYYQDVNGNWHVAKGEVSHDGLYYVNVYGERVWYLYFDEEARKFGKTGTWTVRCKDCLLSESVSSSSPSPPKLRAWNSDTEEEESGSRDTGGRRERKAPARRSRVRAGPTRSQQTQGRRRGGGGGRGDQRDSELGVAPEEVGTRHRSPQEKNRGRLGRLQAEARDPPIIIVRGSPGSLKSWRFRVKHSHRDLIYDISTTFTWCCSGEKQRGGTFARLLIAFTDEAQLTDFMKYVPMPKTCTVSRGSLDGL